MDYPLIKPSYYRSLLKEIITFIKKPIITARTDKPLRIKIYDTIGLYLLKLVFLIPVVLFFALIYDPKNIQSVSMSERFSPLIFLLIGGIILPLVEEIGFRLALVFKPMYLALSSGVFTYYFMTKVVFQTKISMIDDTFMIRVLMAISIGIILFPILNVSSIRTKLSSFWVKNFRTIYYVSCIIFAWMHITKYEITLLNIMLLPILTIPQLLSAIIYGYTRVAFGFAYPLLLHITMNVLTIGLSLLPFTD